MKKIVTLPVHGVGNTEMNFAEELGGNLSRELGEILWQWIKFYPNFYQKLIIYHKSIL